MMHYGPGYVPTSETLPAEVMLVKKEEAKGTHSKKCHDATDNFESSTSHFNFPLLIQTLLWFSYDTVTWTSDSFFMQYTSLPCLFSSSNPYRTPPHVHILYIKTPWKSNLLQLNSLRHLVSVGVGRRQADEMDIHKGYLSFIQRHHTQISISITVLRQFQTIFMYPRQS